MSGTFGSVVLVSFPFTDSAAEKRRPALVLADAGDGDLLLARISTRPVELTADVAITQWQTAGLLAPSSVRLQKLATIHSRLVTRTLGVLHDDDAANVKRTLIAMWQAILP